MVWLELALFGDFLDIRCLKKMNNSYKMNANSRAYANTYIVLLYHVFCYQPSFTFLYVESRFLRPRLSLHK